MDYSPWETPGHVVVATNGTPGNASIYEKQCVAWVDNSLAECVQNWWGVMSVFIGYSSIGFWIFAQAPQLYLNFKNKNADSLALPFLAAWLIGDTTNLVGSILSKQLASQIYTSIYFCIIDVVLFAQFLMYTVFRKKKQSRKKKAPGVTVAAVTLLAAVGGLTMLHGQTYEVSQQGTSRLLHSHEGAPLVDVASTVGEQPIDESAGFPFVQGDWHTVGYIFGIVSACFYLFSRIPQIVKNYKRRSTGGLSFIMFLMAIMGNTTYALGVLLAAWQPYLYDDESPPNRITTKAFIMDKLPWLFGSVGTLAFDLTIFFQFWYYGDKSLSVMEEFGVPEDGESRPLLTDGNITPPDSDDSFEDDDTGHRAKLLGSPLFFPASKKASSYQNLAGKSKLK